MATQSSTLTWDGQQTAVAQKAVDGDRTTISHTECTGDQWWEVDLGMMYDINRINVVHRQTGSDSVLRRLQFFFIRFYDIERNLVHEIYQEESIQEKAWDVNVSAQFVKLFMPDNGYRDDDVTNCIHLAEFEVFGVEVRNLFASFDSFCALFDTLDVSRLNYILLPFSLLL